MAVVQESLFGSILPIYPFKMAAKTAKWKKNLHIPALIMLQLIFIILFAIFVDYNPKSAKPLPNGALDATKDENSKETNNTLNVYPSK